MVAWPNAAIRGVRGWHSMLYTRSLMKYPMLVIVYSICDCVYMNSSCHWVVVAMCLGQIFLRNTWTHTQRQVISDLTGSTESRSTIVISPSTHWATSEHGISENGPFANVRFNKIYPVVWINGNTLECSPHQLLFHIPCSSAGYLRQALWQARIYSGFQVQLSPERLLCCSPLC